MTDCDNAAIRDLLPDMAAGTLPAAEASRVAAHVNGCADCAAELSLIRTARALRPHARPIDVPSIVAQLPRPAVRMATAPSLDRAARRPAWQTRGVWRMAATLGVIIAGGWSVMLLRSGSLATVGVDRVDSARLSDTGAIVALSPSTSRGGTSSPTDGGADGARGAASARTATAVSFGDLGDYSDEELQRVLDRLDKWDGATSTETMSTTPIVPVDRGGSE